MKRVLIINTSDANGGAAVVSHRLMSAMRKEGIDARMLVVDKRTDDENVDIAGTPEQYKWAFYGERLRIWIHNGFSRKHLFKVSTADRGVDVLSHPWVKAADVVILNWINQGMMSLYEIRQLCKTGKKVLWTMHDMWCLTGVCHHAYGCDHYKDECEYCKFINVSRRKSLASKTWKIKKSLYQDYAIKFVVVSDWLKQRCRESSLLADQSVTVIPNTLPISQYQYAQEKAPRKKQIVMGAARLDDPVKGFDLMIEAMNQIADNYPDMASGIRLVLFGNLRDESQLQKLRVDYKWMGPVTTDQLNDIYRSCDVVLSSSHFETFGATLVEGMASGCKCVAFNHGGQSDIIDDGKNGFLAKYPSTDSLSECIINAFNLSVSREELHRQAEEKFSEKSVVRKYIELIEK